MVDGPTFGTIERRRCSSLYTWQSCIYWLVGASDRKNYSSFSSSAKNSRLQREQKCRNSKKAERKKRRRNGDASSMSVSKPSVTHNQNTKQSFSKNQFK